MKPNNTYRFWDRLKISTQMLLLRLALIFIDILVLIILLIAWIPMLLMKKQFYKNYIHVLKSHRSNPNTK